MPNIDTAIHDEIDNVVRPRKQNRDEGSIIWSPEKNTAEESKKIIKRMYNPETDQEDAEARNTILVGINKVAVENNVDPQEIADLIYGKGVINIEQCLDDSWTNDYARFKDGHSPRAEKWKSYTWEDIENFEVDPKTRIDVMRLSIRATPQDVLKPVFWKLRDGKLGLQIFHSEALAPGIGLYRHVGWLPFLEEVKDFTEANDIIRKEIQKLREKRKYKVTELENDPRNSKGDGKKEENPKEGKLDVNPGGNGDGGIDRENLDFEKLLTQLKNTKDEQWAFEQLTMLDSHNSGASREIINQAAINVLQNQNLQHQPKNLVHFFENLLSYENTWEVIQVFWELPTEKLIAFVQEFAHQDIIRDPMNYKFLLLHYRQLPEQYQELYLSEIAKKFLPEKLALQDFLKKLNSLAGTRISEEDFFSGNGIWVGQLPEKYIIRETSKNQSYFYFNKEALQRDRLDFSSFDKYYNQVQEFEKFKRDKDI